MRKKSYDRQIDRHRQTYLHRGVYAPPLSVPCENWARFVSPLVVPWCLPKGTLCTIFQRLEQKYYNEPSFAGHLRVSKKKLTWNCAPWCITPKVVHNHDNAPNGAQMPHRRIKWCTNAPQDVQTHNQTAIRTHTDTFQTDTFCVCFQ